MACFKYVSVNTAAGLHRSGRLFMAKNLKVGDRIRDKRSALGDIKGTVVEVYPAKAESVRIKHDGANDAINCYYYTRSKELIRLRPKKRLNEPSVRVTREKLARAWYSAVGSVAPQIPNWQPIPLLLGELCRELGLGEEK